MQASVIIPYADRPEHIEHTLRALDAQTSTSFEVIVSDYGRSSDRVERLARKGWRFGLRRVVPTACGASRVARARNAGAAAARGELLIFLDCDIIVRPDFVQQHLRGFE